MGQQRLLYLTLCIILVTLKGNYTISLDGEVIGSTDFEKADAPMGVITGKVFFNNDSFDYAYFKQYCIDREVQITLDDSESRAIGTSSIPGLIVTTKSGKEIKGAGTYIEGMDSHFFEVTVVGFPYPDYELEFPHHVKAYEEQFK